MPQLTDDEKNRLFDTLDAQTRQLQSLERGMYGDKDNRVKGVLDRLAHIEAWVTRSKMKIAYISGAVGAAVVGLKMGWDWIVEHWKKL